MQVGFACRKRGESKVQGHLGLGAQAGLGLGCGDKMSQGFTNGLKAN